MPFKGITIQQMNNTYEQMQMEAVYLKQSNKNTEKREAI